MAQWKNRIVGYANVPTEQLKENPRNWRTHNKRQQETLAGVMHEIGVVQNIIVNKRTGLVVDGHLRLSLAIRDEQDTVPVTFVDLSEQEELTILTTFDPIAALAGTDTVQLDTLLRDIGTTDAHIMDLLSSMADQNKMYTLPATTSPDKPFSYEDEQSRQAEDKSTNLLGDSLGRLYKPVEDELDDDDDDDFEGSSYTSVDDDDDMPEDDDDDLLEDTEYDESTDDTEEPESLRTSVGDTWDVIVGDTWHLLDCEMHVGHNPDLLVELLFLALFDLDALAQKERPFKIELSQVYADAVLKYAKDRKIHIHKSTVSNR